jgi:hypothetical protein
VADYAAGVEDLPSGAHESVCPLPTFADGSRRPAVLVHPL